MIVTIHQPNFIPWYPFFQKMQQADLFIILGHCQFEKNGYQNRFFFQDKWNTLSVKKGLESIKDKQYVNASYDWGKLKKSLAKYDPILSELDGFVSNNLYETNVGIIKHLAERLKIDTPILEDRPTSLTSTERLLAICKEHGATAYLAGQGGKDYLDESLFMKEGIEIIYQENLHKIHTIEWLHQQSY